MIFSARGAGIIFWKRSGRAGASPPCETFPRATYANTNGPRPLRSHSHARGFPWLQKKNRQRVRDANVLVEFTAEIVKAQAEHANGMFLLEHPEDLGAMKDGQRPASIWQWKIFEEMMSTHCTGAVYQNNWGR
jgi:hypothetical protein